MGRLGARVTGADFSEDALAVARRLAAETGLEAKFVQSDVYALPEVLEGSFDVVYTSHGVLPWLPDLGVWAGVISHFLAPGGIFYLMDGHPYLMTLDNEVDGLEIRYPYFNPGQAFRFEATGTYAVDSPVRTFPTNGSTPCKRSSCR